MVVTVTPDREKDTKKFHNKDKDTQLAQKKLAQKEEESSGPLTPGSFFSPTYIYNLWIVYWVRTGCLLE